MGHGPRRNARRRRAGGRSTRRSPHWSGQEPAGAMAPQGRNRSVPRNRPGPEPPRGPVASSTQRPPRRPPCGKHRPGRHRPRPGAPGKRGPGSEDRPALRRKPGAGTVAPAGPAQPLPLPAATACQVADTVAGTPRHGAPSRVEALLPSAFGGGAVRRSAEHYWLVQLPVRQPPRSSRH
jgi:hypothetical protein